MYFNAETSDVQPIAAFVFVTYVAEKAEGEGQDGGANRKTILFGFKAPPKLQFDVFTVPATEFNQLACVPDITLLFMTLVEKVLLTPRKPTCIFVPAALVENPVPTLP